MTDCVLVSDTRSVSVQITNILALAIITTLAGGLLFISGEIVETQSEQAVEKKVTELGTDIQTTIVEMQQLQSSATEANTTVVVSVAETNQIDSWDVRLVEDVPDETVLSAGIIVEVNDDVRTRQVFPVAVDNITESAVSNRDVRITLSDGTLELEPVV